MTIPPPLNITLQHCLIGTIAHGHLFREWWQEACGCWQGWGSHKARKIKWTWLGEDFISKANKSTFILLTVECHLRFLSQRMTWNTTRAEFKYLPSSQAARLSLPYSSEWYVTGCATATCGFLKQRRVLQPLRFPLLPQEEDCWAKLNPQCTFWQLSAANLIINKSNFIFLLNLTIALLSR